MSCPACHIHLSRGPLDCFLLRKVEQQFQFLNDSTAGNCAELWLLPEHHQAAAPAFIRHPRKRQSDYVVGFPFFEEVDPSEPHRIFLSKDLAVLLHSLRRVDLIPRSEALDTREQFRCERGGRYVFGATYSEKREHTEESSYRFF